MTPLDLQSERVNAMGNIVSEGVLNQLGRPRLDRLTVLIREAGQNSWDAKADEAPTVRFSTDLYEVSEEQRRILRNTVFRSLPKGVRLAEALDRRRADPLRLLAISDRGTKGLGGPTRADLVGRPDEPRDFVDFMRNVGEPPRRIAGGTYGYGKTAFYRASGPRAILAYTRCRVNGRVETRFIAAALGDSHIAERVRYTGRHWWGRLVDGIVEPATGAEANELGLCLGLPTFDGTELGTSVVVIDPQLDGRTPMSASAHIAEALLWHFWPKMLPGDTGAPAMEFHVSCDGLTVVVPDPRSTPPLNGFAEAMSVVKGRAIGHPIALESAQYPIASQRPAAHLGRLALVKFGHVPRRHLADDDRDGAWVIPDLAHHVALMRGPELVVKYMEGPVLPGATIEYAGSFLVDPAVESAFAKSEPPTHDDWSPDMLENDWERRYVRIAQRRIAEILQEYASPLPVESESVTTVGGLGGFSDELGSIFLGEAGSGLSVPDDGGTAGSRAVGGTRPRRPRLTIAPDGGHLELFEGRRAFAVDFAVEHVPGSTRSIVLAESSVVLEGHAIETDPPAGAGSPEVICWVGPDGRRHTGDRLIVSGQATGMWRVYVSVPTDAAIALDLQAVSGGAE
ncbi:MAG: hypothetical protein FIA92_11500 [Chloroflexi bacterium]|nr:hypothetical protein [Chloroflexota bacterium]